MTPEEVQAELAKCEQTRHITPTNPDGWYYLSRYEAALHELQSVQQRAEGNSTEAVPDEFGVALHAAALAPAAPDARGDTRDQLIATITKWLGEQSTDPCGGGMVIRNRDVVKLADAILRQHAAPAAPLAEGEVQR